MAWQVVGERANRLADSVRGIAPERLLALDAIRFHVRNKAFDFIVRQADHSFLHRTIMIFMTSRT